MLQPHKLNTINSLKRTISKFTDSPHDVLLKKKMQKKRLHLFEKTKWIHGHESKQDSCIQLLISVLTTKFLPN